MIDLRPITKTNWKDCATLTVTETQRDFVPSNLYSIAEAQFYPDSHPLAVYNASGILVGFVLYGRDERSGKGKLFRLMIDAAHQRRGYGAAALREVVKRIHRHDDADEILVCYHVSNAAARALYHQAGFRECSTAGQVVTAALKPVDDA